MKGMTPAKWMSTLFPYYRWMQSCQWKDRLQNDLTVDITVGVMLVKDELQNHKLTSLGMPCFFRGSLSGADFCSSIQAKVAHETVEGNGSNSLFIFFSLPMNLKLLKEVLVS